VKRSGDWRGIEEKAAEFRRIRGQVSGQVNAVRTGTCLAVFPVFHDAVFAGT